MARRFCDTHAVGWRFIHRANGTVGRANTRTWNSLGLVMLAEQKICCCNCLPFVCPKSTSWNELFWNKHGSCWSLMGVSAAAATQKMIPILACAFSLTVCFTVFISWLSSIMKALKWAASWEESGEWIKLCCVWFGVNEKANAVSEWGASTDGDTWYHVLYFCMEFSHMWTATHPVGYQCCCS